MSYSEGYDLVIIELYLIDYRFESKDKVRLVDLNPHLVFLLVDAGELSFEDSEDRISIQRSYKVSYTIHACLLIV